nr:U17_MYRTX_Ta1h [Tetramorium africanum]
MEKNRTNIFSIYLMVTFLLISIFITMVISESNVINAPNRCPPGHVVVKGRCRLNAGNGRK